MQHELQETMVILSTTAVISGLKRQLAVEIDISPFPVCDVI